MWGARPPTPDAELWGGVAQSSTRKHKDGLGATPENQRGPFTLEHNDGSGAQNPNYGGWGVNRDGVATQPHLPPPHPGPVWQLHLHPLHGDGPRRGAVL